MEVRSFGSTDMRVSRLGLGTHELSGVSFSEVERVLHAAFDAGINVIDTAECYGQSEEAIGNGLGTQRHSCYLFTKCGHASGFDLPDWHPTMLERSIERSLKRLQTDYLDLVQLHSCSAQTLKRGEVVEALQRARDAGKVRYIGYSGDRQAASYAVKLNAFDALQTSVNIADQEAIDLTLPVAITQHMGVIAKRPLANTAWKTGHTPTQPQMNYWKRLNTLKYDFLSGNVKDILSTALRFTLSIPGVDIAIVGTTNPDRFQQNIALLEAGPLPQAQFDAIRKRWLAVTWWRKVLPGGRLGWHSTR
ncbi:MAG: aldo/keto reductase [Ktedonobacteraceae bacterium]